ncbi:MAG: ABC transporter substrate-binding protein [Bacteroidetes bacterium SB0662_bin_6]|nr:ABC transporter substrate-binding protein [Bacteroidetes bacterium SB0668_bin_1]MYE03657.1 ABC transporter substrate-binding protein [Bacteroidetes bacterium SB0662_bin_6]
MRPINLILFGGLVLLAGACRPTIEQPETNSTTAAAFEPGTDYFPDKAEIQYAEHFSVTYHGHYKVVRTHAEVRPWRSDTAPEPHEDVMVLVQRGTPPPPRTGDLEDATVLTIPVTTIAVNNDGTLAFVQALKRSDAVLAVGGLHTYDDTLRQRVEAGEIGQIGYSWRSEPDLEVLLDRQPDIAFLTVDTPYNVKALGRARELGLPAAAMFEWAEAHYLGRTEWIKYLALFVNAERDANTMFESVASRVADLKALAASAPHSPMVLWGYYGGNGRWWMHRNNLEARFLHDANAFNPYENFDGDHHTEGEPISSEQLLVAGTKADHWIIGDIHAAELPPDTYMNRFTAWTQGALYHNYKRTKWEYNAYDWFETALVRPDWVLADLVTLLHPEVLRHHETIFFDLYEKP